MLKHILFCTAILASIAFSTGMAQMGAGRGMQQGSYQVHGTVVDKQSGHAIEYASVVLYNRSDSSLYRGTVTDASGTYSFEGVSNGNYYLEVRFMGYESRRLNSIKLTGTVTTLDPIALDAAAIRLGEVEVAADRAPVTYQIDKKIINVERQITAASGTAVDVLTNVPSVTVDLDGNVALRGSGSFTVLIDGRPSTLEGSEALAQIPSSSIENIEIITNPSAKYDPEGVSGIINVILKKENRAGITGTFNAGIGTQDQASGSAMVTLTGKSYSVYVGADYMKRGGGSTIERSSTYQNPDGDLFIDADGAFNHHFERYGARAGAGFVLSPDDNLDVGAQIGYRDHGGESALDYVERQDGQTPLSYLSKGKDSHGGNYYSGNVNYEHRFEGDKHKVSAEFSMRGRDGDEESTDELMDMAGILTSGRKSTEEGPGQMMNLRLDYLRPVTETISVETGYEAKMSHSDDNTTLSEYDTLAGEYVHQDLYNRATSYERNIHAIYGLTKGQFGSLGVQVGLRGEYTGRTVEADTEGTFEIDRWDYFPTVHLSYKLNETQQFIGSYTRRIERPRGWNLEPFLTWMDAYTVRSGNPGLKPEYINALELGFQTNLGKNMFSVEGYHRITENNIEYVESVYEENITLRQPVNAGTETSSGVELMLNVDPVKFWDVYLLGNLYNYSVKGDLDGYSFDAERFTWNVRFNNTFKLTSTTVLQANAQYNSKSVSAQSRTEGFYTIDLALKQDLFQRRLSMVLNWQDVFHTAKRETYTDGRNFTSYHYMLRDAPMISFNVKYFLNSNGKRQQQPREDGSSYGEDDL